MARSDDDPDEQQVRFQDLDRPVVDLAEPLDLAVERRPQFLPGRGRDRRVDDRLRARHVRRTAPVAGGGVRRDSGGATAPSSSRPSVASPRSLIRG